MHARVELADVSVKVAQVGRSGRFGPYLDEHPFFEGWDAWGSGIPAPIADLVPAEVVAHAGICDSAEGLVASRSVKR